MSFTALQEAPAADMASMMQAMCRPSAPDAATLAVIGLNFRTAPLTLREKVAFNPQQLAEALPRLTAHPAIREAFILSTCNRTELYAVVDARDDVLALLGDALAGCCRADAGELRDSLYLRTGADAARHLFRVAAGLESMVLGEAEIVHQIKQMAGIAFETGASGTILRRLIEKALSASKQARTQARYDECGLSVAAVAVSACKRLAPDLGDLSVMVLGAGDTAELTLHYLISKGVRNVVIANRTLAHAEQLARLTGGTAIPLADFPAYLPTVDVVISCTASPRPILTAAMLSPTPRHDRQPLLIIDLAVPRDVEAAVAALPGVELLNIDNLHGAAADTSTLRQTKFACAEKILDAETQEFAKWLDARRAITVVHALRRQIEGLRAQAADELLAALPEATADQRALVDRQTHALVHDILTASLAMMQQLIGADDASEQMDMARRVLDQRGLGPDGPTRRCPAAQRRAIRE